MEATSKGLLLLKKGQSGIRLLFGRMGLVILALVLKILTFIAVCVWFEDYIVHYYGSNIVITVVMVLHLLNTKMEPNVRNTWFAVILFAPIFGSLLYIFTRIDLGRRMLLKVSQKYEAQERTLLPQDPDVMHRLQEQDPGAYRLCSYVSRIGNCRVFSDTKSEYIPLGENKLEQMLEELEKAKEYIYLEYFIVSEGLMWGRILEVLARKAKEGVDVRILYDGACEFILLPKNYPQKLAKLGIACKVFSPFKPFVSTHYNYRDHRKILVIDGHTAFNGGINLSDEYINVGSRFGHWKDTAVMLRGPAAQGFALMFLQMWNMDEKVPDYRWLAMPEGEFGGQGFVMPFGDNPLDDTMVGHRVYADMLNRAMDHVRIMTPYLILDSAMEDALCYAAARGVKVELLLPGIPDKYVPYALAKTHYKTLLDAGVEIYEYTPGFVHGKMVTTDGTEAVVGTINFDYRSFCHHFECGTYLHGSQCITDIERDFDQCLLVSRKVSYDTIRKEKWHRKLIGYLLKGFSPLL